jgi:hypothetical protein
MLEVIDCFKRAELPRCVSLLLARFVAYCGASKCNVGVQGNNGRAKESSNPTFLTPINHLLQ